MWSTAYVDIAWRSYARYGDIRILREHYASLVRYMDYLATQGRAELHPRVPGANPLFEPTPPGPLGCLQLSQWGDHLSLVEGWTGRSGLPLSISTAFYYHNATVMEHIARALGKVRDAGKYKELAVAIRTAFNRTFFNSQQNCYDNGSQAAQAFALCFGLVPKEKRLEATKTLVDNIFQKHGGHLTTGLVGTSCVIEALMAVGRPDLVWRLATVKGYPSWSDMLQGMTTTKEAWNGGSFSHVALAAPVDAWCYTTLAGIQVDDRSPGYERVIIKPYIPSDLDWVNASVDGIRGKLISSWRKENNALHLDVTIPANASATVFVPTDDVARVLESGKPAVKSEGVVFRRIENAAAVFEIDSGSYCFLVRPKGANTCVR